LQTHSTKTFLTPLVRIDEDLPSAREKPPYLTYVKIDLMTLTPYLRSGMERNAPLCILRIVECLLNKLHEWIGIADTLEFGLFDLTSPGYNHEFVSQLDVSLLNRAFKSNVPSFQPWQIHGPEVQWNHWVHLD